MGMPILLCLSPTMAPYRTGCPTADLMRSLTPCVVVCLDLPPPMDHCTPLGHAAFYLNIWCSETQTGSFCVPSCPWEGRLRTHGTLGLETGYLPECLNLCTPVFLVMSFPLPVSLTVSPNLNNWLMSYLQSYGIPRNRDCPQNTAFIAALHWHWSLPIATHS